MKEITEVREFQEIQFEILKKIHVFCETNNIRYSLCAGTLLGAIRHNGFIPWDDDVDVMMPRPDYMRFCAEFKAEGVSVHDILHDSEYFFPFAKVYDDATVLKEPDFPRAPLGVCVDVFPIDGFMNEEEAHQALRTKQKIYPWETYKHLRLYRKGRGIVRTLGLLVLRAMVCMFPIGFFTRMLQKRVMIHNFDQSSIVGVAVWGYDLKEYNPKCLWDSFVDVEFEGLKFKSLVGWDAYLRHLYGDYMQLPPPEKRVTHHLFKAWRK